MESRKGRIANTVYLVALIVLLSLFHGWEPIMLFLVGLVVGMDLSRWLMWLSLRAESRRCDS